MSKTPYSHEPSWFAAVRHIAGKGSGYIIREPYIEDEKPSAYVYMDGVTDGMTAQEVETFISKAAALVNENGLFIASVIEPHIVSVIKQTARHNLYLIEDSHVVGRTVLVYSRTNTPKPVPEVIVYRNGAAIGDAYYASAVATEYAKLGFTLAVMTSDAVKSVYEHNPHVKEIIPVPLFDHETLLRFMEFWSRRVRLFVCLDWSIEGHLLKKDVSNGFFWSDLQRRKICAKSYANNVAELAGLDSITIQHYSSEEDIKFAEDEKQKLGDYVFIQLSGSGDTHKKYPYWAELIMMILARTNLNVYLSFTQAHLSIYHKIADHIKANYGSLDRIFRTDSKRSFNQNAEIARRSACLVAPETGIITAFAHDEFVPKVLLLSHSAPENFSDWKNIKFVSAIGRVECASCHRIHFNWSWCVQDKKTEHAACQAAIDPSEIFDAIMDATNYAK